MFVLVVPKWKSFPNDCVGENKENLAESKHPKGDTSFGKCQEECELQSKCSAFEWYEKGNMDTKCYLILTDKVAVNGSGNNNSLNATCNIKPGYFCFIFIHLHML